MKSLFDAVSIGTMELKNRLVRSATWENMADYYGHLTPQLFRLYENLAKGETGLIITSYTRIYKYDKPTENMLSIYDDSFIDEYKKLTDMVHSYGSKIVMQIVLGKDYINPKTGIKAYDFDSSLTLEDIEDIKANFAMAAKRAEASGFDGIQIHAAHGYFLSRSISPNYNKREDDYGVNREGRSKLIIEVFKKIKESVSKDFNILIKINCSDFEENGAEFDDCRYVCKELSKLSIDAIEISGGGRLWRENIKEEAIYFEYAANMSEEIDTPIILVGLNRDPYNMEKILNISNIKFLSISRPLICEPDLPLKWRKFGYEKSKCISCGRCTSETGINCIFHKEHQ